MINVVSIKLLLIPIQFVSYFLYQEIMIIITCCFCQKQCFWKKPKIKQLQLHITDEVRHLTFTGNVSELTWPWFNSIQNNTHNFDTTLPKMDSPPNSIGDSSVPYVTIMSQDELAMLDKKVSNVWFFEGKRAFQQTFFFIFSRI